MENNSKIKLFSLLALCTAISACDSSSSSNTGTLSLNVTDAPIDSAAKVVVSFSGVTIKPEDGPAYDIDFKDENDEIVVKSIDLLTQQGADSEPLLVNETLDAGHYNWLRLKVISSDSSLDSYIELDGGEQHPLYVPSGDQNGLKLNQGFDITDGGSPTFTIDFDLRKSVVAPGNNSQAYKLKPTLRIVNNENVGHITGQVLDNVINHVDCAARDAYAVYAFSGENVQPDDVDGIDPDPVSTALLSDTYEYTLGFLEEGSYTLAFTCMADIDIATTSDDVGFITADNVTVTAGATATHDID